VKATLGGLLPTLKKVPVTETRAARSRIVLCRRGATAGTNAPSKRCLRYLVGRSEGTMSTPAKPPGAETPVRRSLLIYAGLMAYLAAVAAVFSVVSVKVVVASQAELFRWPMVAVLTLLGGISVWLGPRVGFPGLWDARISTQNRLVFPALVGLGLGVVNLALQGFTGAAHIIAEAANVSSINVAFPDSLLFYSAGAIILEAIYRLIPITLPLWLIANVILRKRGQTPVFWTLALFTSAIEPAEQIGFFEGHHALIVITGVSTYALNVFEAHLWRRYGFLAPLAFRVAYYVVWHIVGGALGF
jgi:hypothetical protein